MMALSGLASALLLVSGAAAQAATDCSSLRKAISSYSTATANSGLDTSTTTFNSLLDVLGFSDAVIGQLGSGNVLVPTDRALVDFIAEVGGPDVDPMAFVMTHPNTFKQIVLYHFTGPMSGNSGESTTGLAAMERLKSFIDTSVICGREDSVNVKLQFMAGDTPGILKLQEPVGKHFTATANRDKSICKTDTVTVTTVDKVLTPCPNTMTFPDGPPGERGCMTVAMATAELAMDHPLGTLPYGADASRVMASLKHPNLLMNSGEDLTVFLPTADSLKSAGVVTEDFIAIPNALDHVVMGHVAQQAVCMGGQIPTGPVLTNAADGTFCKSEGTLTIVKKPDSALQVVADGTDATATITEINNIAVCGGLLHVVNNVLMPCALDEYSNINAEAGSAASSSTSRGVDAAPMVITSDGASAMATGVAFSAIAAAALLL